AVWRPHWLTRLVCEVDDGEPAVAKADILSRRKPEAGTVGTTMRQERRLELEPWLQVRNRAALDVHYSRDTAHWLTRLSCRQTTSSGLDYATEKGCSTAKLREPGMATDDAPLYSTFSVSA